MRSLIALAAAIAVIVSVSPARADDCCRFVIEGCGKKSTVCAPGDCSNSASTLARDMVRKIGKCEQANVSSYIHSCENEKCTYDMRK